MNHDRFVQDYDPPPYPNPALGLAPYRSDVLLTTWLSARYGALTTEDCLILVAVGAMLQVIRARPKKRLGDRVRTASII